jgi:calcineurin-like phosphoesterase family protein
MSMLRFPRKPLFLLVALLTSVLSARGARTARDFDPSEIPPPGFKVAFLGDQGMGPVSESVLKLVKSEGAHLLVHLGDFDYQNSPQAWEDQTDRILGADFPQIAVVGNHDLPYWYGPKGYSSLVAERLKRMGVTVDGVAGERCSFRYQGIFFVLTAPGLIGTGHAQFIRDRLAADSTPWRISAWHVNQRLMQVGGKSDEAGWGVYEESRRGGAIIATAHEHSYSRTHLLNNMTTREVASTGDSLELRKGRTFAFVSGLGGGEVRPQSITGPWWAKTYTASQGATAGAMFATFNVDGNPLKARFEFKAINGAVPDRFDVYSDLDRPIKPGIAFKPDPAPERARLELDPKELGIPIGGRLLLLDSHGRTVADINPLRGQVSLPLPHSGLIFLRIETSVGIQIRKFVILP